MITFFTKTPEITLDCFTSMPMVYEHTPIIKSSKAIPKWWTDVEFPKEKYRILNKKIFNNANVRTCYGFIELYRNGVVLENWADVIIKTTPKNFEVYSTYGPGPESFPKSVYGQGFKDWFHLKLASPWHIKEKTGVKIMWVGAEWGLENFNFRVLPGIINYKLNTTTNVNLMLPPETKEYTIPVGHPLVHIIPMTDHKLNIKNHLVTESELDTIKKGGQGSLYGWRRYISLMKRNEERESSCPFK